MKQISSLRHAWRVRLALLSFIGGLVATPIQAQDASATSEASASATGEVRRVDVAGGKVTLIHGPISDLQLPAMTLVYQAPSALLQGLLPGDKVKFSAQRQNNTYVLTAISK